MPAPGRVDGRVPAVAMALAPAVGLVPGGCAAAVAWGATSAGLSAPVAAVLVLAVLALVTRGLHLDGLTDTADGLAAGYDRERALDVMRRGDTGPVGAAALVLTLGVQAAALTQALERHGAVVALVAAVAGRACLPMACARGVPAARSAGLGATVASAVPVPVAVAALLGAAALTALTALPAGLPPAHAALAVAVAAVGGAVVVARAVRRLGGITGDVLGAVVELGTAAALLTLAAR